LPTTRQIRKKTTTRNYDFLLSKFRKDFGDREPESLTQDEILSFLTQVTQRTKQSTRKLRFSLLRCFFNYIRTTLDPSFQNPCDTPVLRRAFKVPKQVQWKIVDKEVVDEIIFRTRNPRNRLILELMARGGMRIGEVLKLTPADIGDRKLTIHEPKSGKEQEVVFIPQKVADRLKEYIKEKGTPPHQKVFHFTYGGARLMVWRAGKMVGIHLRPHDLRRHAATYASRSGTPIEIVSKVILRHSNLSTTQRYLGKVSEPEALRWIENLYG